MRATILPAKETVAAVNRLRRLPGQARSAMHSATRQWAAHVQREAAQESNQRSLPPRRLYPYRMATPTRDTVAVGWKLVYVPMFLEYGVRRHIIAARAWRRVRMRGKTIKVTKPSRRTLQGPRPGARVLRYVTSRGQVRYARWVVHPGFQARYPLRRTITANKDQLGSAIRTAVNQTWMRGGLS